MSSESQTGEWASFLVCSVVVLCAEEAEVRLYREG